MALHEVQLKGYSVRPGNLSLGTFGSYGIEQLHVTLDDTWSGLAVTATFNPPKGEPREIRLPENGLIDVPAEATANEGTGTIVYCGVANGVQRITKTQGYNVITRGPVGGTEPFKPSESLATQVLQAALNAEKNSAEAKSVADNLRNDAANGKFDGKDGAKGDKGDTGDKGNTGAKGDKGDKGFSPTAAVTQLENGAEITITDEEGTTKATVKNGSKGDKGDRGSDGVSPTISVEDIENGHRVTIVDATGTTSVDIYNGEDGTDGKDGAQVDDSSIGDKPWSSKHIIDMLCPPLQESGNPVVCYPVAGYALGVKAKWEPVQEGSGTPYPAGGGKQLLDTNKCVPTVGKPYGMTITLDGDVFKVSGVPNEEVTATEPYSFAVCTCNQEELRGKGYKATAWAIKGNVNNAWGLRTESESSLAIAAELTPGVNNDIQLRLMVSKDTPTAWEPYENIRPIKGRDSVRVERCGKNLWGLGNVGFRQIKELSANYPAGRYVLSCDIETESTSDTVQLGWLVDGKWKYTQVKKNVRIKVSISASVGISAFRFYAGSSPANNDNATYKNIQLELGDTPTTYTPYIGQTNTLTLPETVYGGEVDAVSGEGAGTWEYLTLTSDMDWHYDTSNKTISATLSQNDLAEHRNGKCSHLKYFYDFANGSIFVAYRKISLGRKETEKWTVETWKAYLAAQNAAGTPVQIAYKLAEPVPFTATGAQPLPALAGANTVLTDADGATVTGRADPVKRIEDLEAAVASIN